MKKIIMFSGIDKEKGFTLDQTKELTRNIEIGKSIVFIASSFDTFEKNDYFINRLIGFFKDISIRFNKINIIDNRISKEEAKDIVKNSDIVFIIGGDPKKEMDSINEYGLSNILRDRDGITIGVSAGSINMAKDVIYMDEDEHKTIIKYKGIGLTDICIYPHMDFNNIDYLKEMFDVSKEQKITGLPNESFIVIEDNDIKYINEHYDFENETIDYKGVDAEKINHVGTIELETDRLILRKTTMEDYEEAFYLQLNPKIRKFLGGTKLGNNLEKSKKYFSETIYNDKEYYRWSIIRKEDNKFLGTIYLNLHSDKARTAGIDYWIREDAWGYGYTTEAAKKIMEFAFLTLDLNRIESCGAKDNVGTWKVMENIGLKYEGTREKSYFYYYGGIQDMKEYGLTKEEYLEKINK